MAKVWCVRYRDEGGDRDAWCAVAGNIKPDEDATSVPTKCGHFVILPLGTSRREPTCAECREDKP